MADINLPASTVTASPAANHSDTELLAALQAAHDAGDEKGAMEIAQMLSAQAPTHEPLPTDKQGGGDSAPPGMSLWDATKAAGKDVMGIGDEGLSMLAHAVMTPVAGYAGAGADIAHALGANVDPAAVVRSVAGAAYEPHSDAGKENEAVIQKLTGWIPQGANAAGEYVSDKTGSPALGTAVNTGLQGAGMWATGKIPALGSALREAPVIRPTLDFASDMLPGGSNRAATRLIQRYTGQPPAQAAAASAIQQHLDAQRALDAAGNSGSLATKYGIQPTTAQVAGNAGLAQMDRTLRNQAETTTAFNDRDAANQGGINDILHGISGTPEMRLRAATARDFKARTMYDDALNNPEHFVQPPDPAAASFEAELAAKKGLPDSSGKPSTNDPNAPASGLNDIGVRLQEVLQRPAVADAMNNASRQAANRGVKLDSRNLIQQMHYAKLHLDGQISAASRAGNSTDLAGLMDSKNALLGVMDDLSPAYATARSNFATASRPLNRMQVGEALRQKYNSALADAGGTGTRPSQFAEALRKDDGDQLARSATDFGGAQLDKILTPKDMVDLAVARDQLARQQYAQTAGRGVGSNTGQNLANQRALDNVGSVNQVAEDMGPAVGFSAAMHHPGVAIPAAIFGGVTRRGARARLTDMALNPAEALRALRDQPTPSLPTSVPMTAAVGANAQDTSNPVHLEDGPPQGHADGGSIKKSSFWDLVQQAVHEMTTPDDTSPQNAPLGGGAANNAAQQIEANPNRIMNQADAQS